MISRSRLLCVVWVITWVITVPLFHTHLPDISDGQASQSGVAHTVFSPDLPGEFTRVSNAHHQDQFAHLSNWVFNSPELGFVLSECSKGREKGKPLVLGVRCSLPDQPFLPTWAIESSARCWQRLVFAIPQDPRAPPSVVYLEIFPHIVALLKEKRRQADRGRWGRCREGESCI